MDNNEDRNSDEESQQDNSSKNNDDEISQTESGGNVLRRSERNAKNHQNSYNSFNRRSFKYDDDFEYDVGVTSKKGPIEMDPPNVVMQNKRRRKNTNLIAVPFTEGLKRTVSAKTPT